MAPDDDDVPSIDDPRVRRRLDAARGYCELHLPSLAWEEIGPLRKALGHTAELLETELMILMLEKQWKDALTLAVRMQMSLPEHPAGWLQAAFCLHEMGRTREALEKLVSGPRGLRKVALFHYNCGCYLTVLGQLRDAMTSLRRAFEMDGAFRENARNDPDLVPLRDQL